MKSRFLLIAAFCLLPLAAARADDPVLPVAPIAGGSCGDCGCVINVAESERRLIKSEAEDERRHLTQDDFTIYQTWLVNDFFNDYVLPAMKDMAASLTAAGQQQVQIFGSFLDAQQQLQTQRTLANLAADAHQNYQTAGDMCSIGTAAIGMGAAARNAEAVAQQLARRSENRQLGSFDTSSGEAGPATDRASRLATYKARHCNPGDNDGGFAYNTDKDGKAGGICAQNIAAEGIDRDIDYTRTIESPQSLNVNFDGQSFGNQNSQSGSSGAVASAPNDLDIVALDDNLFAHDLFTRESATILKTPNAMAPYLEARSVIAKRSVAENSFFAIAGLKSAGSEAAAATVPYVQAVFEQLGVSAADAKALVGPRPSYYSLLDGMTRRLYQSPQFFSNLYDTPVNVERKDVAMQAIGLLLDRDQYKSELRSEADLAVLLELELGPSYKKVQGQLGGIAPP